MSEIQYYIANKNWICRFGTESGYHYLQVWERDFDHLPPEHKLNRPSKYELDITSLEDLSIHDMMVKACDYGFTIDQFKQLIHEKRGET